MKLENPCDVCGRRETHSENCPHKFSYPTLGRKDDAGKNRWDLVPFRAFKQVVRVLTAGATKYSDNNWQKVPNPRKRYIAAAFRHITARIGGELNDPEDNLPHLAHAVCCLLFLLAFDEGFDADPDHQEQDPL
jgi:hypothetical protein